MKSAVRENVHSTEHEQVRYQRSIGAVLQVRHVLQIHNRLLDDAGDVFGNRCGHGSAEEAARTLKQMFEAEISAGSVQIGAYERAQKIVFRGSKADGQRAADALKVVDMAPDAAPKDKK